jgi:hypothetical protein
LLILLILFNIIQLMGCRAYFDAYFCGWLNELAPLTERFVGNQRIEGFPLSPQFSLRSAICLDVGQQMERCISQRSSTTCTENPAC